MNRRRIVYLESLIDRQAESIADLERENADLRRDLAAARAARKRQKAATARYAERAVFGGMERSARLRTMH